MGLRDQISRLKPETPKRWDDSFIGLHRDMNNLFGDFFRDFMGVEPGVFSIAVDVHENEKDLEVTAEMPGLDEKDIEITLHRDTLTIKGEKKLENDKKEGDYHRIERSYGKFQRTILLPCEVEEDKIEARYQKGVLRINLPKKNIEGDGKKKISIKTQQT